MFQIDNSTAVAAIPAPTPAGSAGYFTDGNPATGVSATILPAEFMNMLMMENMNVLSAAGITPAKGQYNQLALAIRGLIQSGTALYALDTGTANVYTVDFAPIVTALVDGLVLKFKAKTANTGASTFSPNGLAAKPLVGSAHGALQGGEIVANSDAWVQWNSTVGAGSWVLIDSTGGALQVAPATQSQHAMQLGQATGRLLKTTVFASSGSFTPLASTTTVRVRVIGGGGASGGTPATSSTQNSVAGGGGGGGCSEGIMTVAAIGTLPATVTVGAGGVGVSGGNGGTGGTSSFIGMTASGGTGGLAGVASAAAYILQPSAGGDASGGSTTNVKGAPSTPAIFISAGAGVSGAGGGSPVTGSGGGAGGSVAGGGYLAGIGAGAGSGGVAVGSSVAAQVGVAGSAGQICIEEYS